MNHTMLVDFYELTMANGYFESGKLDEVAYFDVFYRKNPDNGGYAIFCGLDSIIKYIQKLHFTEEDISFLRSKQIFSNSFLHYLQSFKFNGDIWSVPEGSVIFPNEPIMTIKANVIEAQIIETFILQTINHQSLIATKASKIVDAAAGRPVIEMGARRAHGGDSSVEGARAAYIGGIAMTSNVLADQKYHVPSGGTMGHSWVQMFENEIIAFETYCSLYPNNVTLLVDTYDTLQSGIPNAIQVLQKHILLHPQSKIAVRIDSGDLDTLSKTVRTMLDQSGLTQCKIIASNSLDEHSISKLIELHAPIDVFGVGERLITAKSDPVFGAVYKLTALSNRTNLKPIIKISDQDAKTTNPGIKELYRLYINDKMVQDYILLKDQEEINLKLLSRKENSSLKLMRNIIFQNGHLIYKVPNIDEVKTYANYQLNQLDHKYRKQITLEQYPVTLSDPLQSLKNTLMSKYMKK